MARKLNPKQARQSNAAAQAMSRKSSGPPIAALYLMRLRAQELRIASTPRRTRVQIEIEKLTETPEPVKIKKVD